MILEKLKEQLELITIQLLAIQKEFESMQLDELDRETFKMLINKSLQEFIYIDEEEDRGAKMLIKINNQWFNSSHIVKISLEDQNIVMLLSNGEKITHCKHSDFNKIDMQGLLDTFAAYINENME